MTPLNSWAGIAFRRGDPSFCWIVGSQPSSVGVTPAAWTRTSTSPAAGFGCGTSAATSWAAPFADFVNRIARITLLSIAFIGASLLCELDARRKIIGACFFQAARNKYLALL